MIVPWQSSQFGFFAEDGETIVPMDEQRFYVDDTFGLRTMDKRGDLHMYHVPKLMHGSWLHDEDLMRNFVLPNLRN